MLEQSEIDALLASAGDGGIDIGGQETVSAPSPEKPRIKINMSEIERILQMRFPVIVNLADRNMNLKQILQWTPGSIVEFDRSSDSELSLLIGNKKIGRGQAVKVGEYFGLRVTKLDPVEDRIRAMGQ